MASSCLFPSSSPSSPLPCLPPPFSPTHLSHLPSPISPPLPPLISSSFSSPLPPPPPSFVSSPNLVSILCKEHIDITGAAVGTKVYPTTHPVSVCACRPKHRAHASLVVQLPIVGMVTTAVPVPAWHAAHGIVTLTHLCVRGEGVCV